MQGNSPPIYSIIIATYNRYEELVELFETMDALDFPSDQWEVVIVDDGSTDSTKDLVESWETFFTVQYHLQSNQGPGAARNLGMTKANGDYYIFIDSDVLLPPDYLTKIHSSLQSSQMDAFGGPDDAHPSFSPLLKAINYSMTSFLGTGGTRGSKNSVTKFYPRSFNMGIHRKVFNKIGGMGGLRHGQDMDFSARIYAAGFKVGLIPEAVVYHKRRTSLWRFFKQIFNWGVARINLGKKHPGMLKAIHLLPVGLLSAVATLIILSPFSIIAARLLAVSVILGFLVAVLAFVQSSLRNQSIFVGFLSAITLFIQVGAYGLGLWSAIFQYAMGKKSATGIVRNYYK